MKNKNESKKEIRFIDSSYNTLFRIPDGTAIQMTNTLGETVILPCRYIDDYHTDIGGSCFHICQFAEQMEKNRAIYEPESEPKEDKAAWKGLGIDRYLTLEKREGGYRYHIFSNEENLLIHNIFDCPPDTSMLDVRNQILKDFSFEQVHLIPVDFSKAVRGSSTILLE